MNPSTVTNSPWVYEDYNSKEALIGNNYVGKWMLFYDLSILDEKWNQVKLLLKQGKLGPSAKCSTAMPNFNANSSSKVIIVYTSNYNDHDDVFRVSKVLYDGLQYGKTMYYKTDEQTLSGSYRKTGSKKNHIYRYPNN
jgi:hypothetical protein